MFRFGSKRLCCSFCGKDKEAVKKFINGPSVYICDECVARFTERLMAMEPHTETGPAVSDRLQRCSFCQKPKGAVKQLLAGPAVYVCNECVVLCNEILVEDDAAV